MDLILRPSYLAKNFSCFKGTKKIFVIDCYLLDVLVARTFLSVDADNHLPHG